MGSLKFVYGAMGCGKSIDLLMSVFKKEDKGKKVIVTKPSTDTKAGNKIQSRLGNLERTVDLLITPDGSYKDHWREWIEDGVEYIFVDESQLLTAEQVQELRDTANFMDVDVICYGLKTNFRGELFEASKKLVEVSDCMEELSSVLCECGDNKAIFNARFVNGIFATVGDDIFIDGSDASVEYRALCPKCFSLYLKGKKNRG